MFASVAILAPLKIKLCVGGTHSLSVVQRILGCRLCNTEIIRVGHDDTCIGKRISKARTERTRQRVHPTELQKSSAIVQQIKGVTGILPELGSRALVTGPET